MLNLDKLFQKPKIFQRLTGLTPTKCQELLSQLEPLFQAAEIKRKSWPNRQRRIGGGNKYKLSVGQALFMLLLYYRTYTNHVFLGMLMGIDESNVCRYFSKIEPLLAQIFKIPERKIEMSQEEILELIVDATEQETEKRGGSGYSGKKKRQTVKTQVIITPQGKIKSVSKPIKGNVHDKKLYERTLAYTTIRVKRKGDLAYLGTSCEIPIKKQHNQELTEKEKEFNEGLNKERVEIEHTFAHLKKFKILSHGFRNSINSYYLIFKNVAGLRNLQIA